MPLHLKIITPLRTAVEADALSIRLPATAEQLEILPGHTALITAVEPGELSYTTTEHSSQSIFVGGGFLQVEDDNALLVTDTALDADEVDPSSVNAAIEQARNRLRNEQSVLSREEQTRLEAIIAKQLAMLEYKNKRTRMSH